MPRRDLKYSTKKRIEMLPKAGYLVRCKVRKISSSKWQRMGEVCKIRFSLAVHVSLAYGQMKFSKWKFHQNPSAFSLFLTARFIAQGINKSSRSTVNLVSTAATITNQMKLYWKYLSHFRNLWMKVQASIYNIQICIQMIQLHQCEFFAYIFGFGLEFTEITFIEARQPACQSQKSEQATVMTQHNSILNSGQQNFLVQLQICEKSNYTRVLRTQGWLKGKYRGIFQKCTNPLPLLGSQTRTLPSADIPLCSWTKTS